MLTRGRLALALAAVFVPVLWLSATAIGGKTPATGPALLPDLQTAVPHHFTVQNQQQRETLRFSNLIANTGQGDLRIRPEHDLSTNITTGFQELLDASGNVVSSQPVSEFVFHPAHNHWHITGVALFEIRLAADNGTTGRLGAVFANQSIKTTFCLIDWIQLDGNSPTGDRTYFECFPDSAQGISAGWGDQYHHALDGQELEVTGAKPGIYYLVSTANHEGNFIETTTANNTAWTSFRLSRDSKGNAKISEISHSPCSTVTLCGENLQNR
jgi:lysyl oxidase